MIQKETQCLQGEDMNKPSFVLTIIAIVIVIIWAPLLLFIGGAASLFSQSVDPNNIIYQFVYNIIFTTISGILGILYSIKNNDKKVGKIIMIISGFMLSGINYVSGPLFIIVGIILLVSKNKNVIQQQKVSQGITKICPFCAKEIKKEDRFCQFCGKELQSVEDEKENKEKTEQEQIIENVESEKTTENVTDDIMVDEEGRKWRKTNQKRGIIVPKYSRYGGIIGTETQGGMDVWELVDEENVDDKNKINKKEGKEWR